MPSTFSLDLPPFPSKIQTGIGFIVTEDFDSRNIKVVQDIAHTAIDRNREAKFAIYSKDDKSTGWILEYLKIYKIPKKNIFEIKIDKDIPEMLHNAYSANDKFSLYHYKKFISCCHLDTIYIFTNRPKCLAVIETVKSSKLFGFKVYSIDSDGNYTDYQNQDNNMNRRLFIEQHSQEGYRGFTRKN